MFWSEDPFSSHFPCSPGNRCLLVYWSCSHLWGAKHSHKNVQPLLWRIWQKKVLMLRILPQVFLTLVTNFHHVFQVVSLKGLLGHLKENYVLISFRKHPLCAYKVGIPKFFFCYLVRRQTTHLKSPPQPTYYHDLINHGHSFSNYVYRWLFSQNCHISRKHFSEAWSLRKAGKFTAFLLSYSILLFLDQFYDKVIFTAPFYI